MSCSVITVLLFSTNKSTNILGSTTVQKLNPTLFKRQTQTPSGLFIIGPHWITWLLNPGLNISTRAKLGSSFPENSQLFSCWAATVSNAFQRQGAINTGCCVCLECSYFTHTRTDSKNRKKEMDFIFPPLFSWVNQSALKKYVPWNKVES